MFLYFSLPDSFIFVETMWTERSSAQKIKMHVAILSDKDKLTFYVSHTGH